MTTSADSPSPLNGSSASPPSPDHHRTIRLCMYVISFLDMFSVSMMIVGQSAHATSLGASSLQVRAEETVDLRSLPPFPFVVNYCYSQLIADPDIPLPPPLPVTYSWSSIHRWECWALYMGASKCSPIHLLGTTVTSWAGEQ